MRSPASEPNAGCRGGNFVSCQSEEKNFPDVSKGSEICDTLGFHWNSLYYQPKTVVFEQQLQWVNRVENLDICRRNQGWVGDITYVRLKEYFVYVSVLVDVFTRIVRGEQVSHHLTESLTLRPLQHALSQSVQRFTIATQGFSIFQQRIFPRSLIMGLRFP